MNILSGAESLVVLSENTGYYDLSIRPLRRGDYRGVIAFVGHKPEMYALLLIFCFSCELWLFTFYSVGCGN